MTPSHTAVPDATATALIPLLPLRTHDAAAASEHDPQARWDLALGRISQELCQPDSYAALSLLQRAMGERNRWEADSQVDVLIASFQWSVLSVCSLPMDEYDAAAAFALRPRESARSCWQQDLLQDCVDSSADVVTLLAVIRLCQREPEKALRLIQQAMESHRLVGDIEQLAADHLIESLCHEALGVPEQAEESRVSARNIVDGRLDASRHQRTSSLLTWLDRYGMPRPRLLKDQFIV